MKKKKKVNLVQYIEQLSDEYVLKGGKRSRQDRVAIMKGFAEHVEASGTREIGQVGASHVIRYWKSHRGLKEATLQNHWYALCDLWKLSKKSGKPPQPWPQSALEKPSTGGMGASPHGD